MISMPTMEMEPIKKPKMTPPQSASVRRTDVDFATSAWKCPITLQRPLASGIDGVISNPGLARASLAVSTDRPHGDEAYSHSGKRAGYTTLQQHVMYFDTDNDGEIFVQDTYRGFRDLGFAIPFCLFCAPIIHLAFSYGTRTSRTYWPDPYFRIYVDGIHGARHGSDTGAYDSEGRFRPQLFEEIFSKYDQDGDGGLTLREIFRMMAGNRVAMDIFGATTAFFEWMTIWLLLQREGKVWKEDLRGIYDGSLLCRIREQRKTEKGWHQGWGVGNDGFIRGDKFW